MSQSYYKHQSRKQTLGIWQLTIFLALTCGVWSTFQSSTNHISGNLSPPLSEENGQHCIEKEKISTTTTTTKQTLGKDPCSKRTNDENNVTKYHFCQKRLMFEVDSVCGKKFHIPYGVLKQEGNQDNTILSRLPRSLVEECCIKPCEKTFLERYCFKRVEENENRSGILSETNREGHVEKQIKNDNTHVVTFGKPESTMYYPLLHLLKFIHDYLGTPKKQSPQKPIFQHSHSTKYPMGSYSQSMLVPENQSRSINDFHPLPGFQKQEQALTYEKGIKINESWQNVVISTLPPLLFPIGLSTDDNSYPLHIISIESKE